MESKYLEYRAQKVLDVEALFAVRFLSLGYEDVDIHEAHDAWCFVYVDGGDAIVGTPRGEHLLHEGDFAFQSPAEWHSLQGAKDGTARIFLISFFCHSPDMKLFENAFGTLPSDMTHFVSALKQDASESFDVPFHTTSGFSLQKRADPIFGGEQCFCNRLELFLIELARKEGRYRHKPPVSKEQIKDELVVRVIGILEDNVYQKITMGYVVENMNYSEPYIAKRFKKACGQSIMSYYVQLRIEEAKRLIRETEKNFTEIAALLGFSDSQHFTKTFQKYVRMSPKEYLQSVHPYPVCRNSRKSGKTY